jgi:hypothetical protein
MVAVESVGNVARVARFQQFVHKAFIRSLTFLMFQHCKSSSTLVRPFDGYVFRLKIRLHLYFLEFLILKY